MGNWRKLTTTGVMSLLLGAGAPAAGAKKPVGLAPVSASPSSSPTVAPTPAAAAATGRGGTCYGEFANPAGSNGYLSSDGKLLYLLASKPAAVASAPSPKPKGSEAAPAVGPKVNGITMYRIDLVTNSATAVLSIKQRPSSILVNHGDPIMGMSALAFPVTPGGCSEGKAVGVNLGFDKKEGSAATLGKANYGVVRATRGTLLVDLDRHSVLETDIQSFQTRIASKYAEGEIPLFYDQDDRHMITWNTSARGISSFKPGIKLADQKIQYKVGDRVLQDRDRFLVMSMDKVANTFSIRVLPKWSKTEKDAIYTFKLPGAYAVGDAQVEVNVEKNLVAVSSVPGPQRMRWQRIYLYHLTTGKLLTTMVGTASQYFEYFGIDQGGTALVAEVRDLNDRTSIEVRKFEIKKKKEAAIKLPMPPI